MVRGLGYRGLGYRGLGCRILGLRLRIWVVWGVLGLGALASGFWVCRSLGYFQCLARGRGALPHFVLCISGLGCLA